MFLFYYSLSFVFNSNNITGLTSSGLHSVTHTDVAHSCAAIGYITCHSTPRQVLPLQAVAGFVAQSALVYSRCKVLHVSGGAICVVEVKVCFDLVALAQAVRGHCCTGVGVVAHAVVLLGSS